MTPVDAFGLTIRQLAEPAVALTDVLLAAECSLFVVLLRRRVRLRLQACFLGIFVCIGVAALLGAIVHGFPSAPGTAHRGLWAATLLSLVAMASFVWVAGAELLSVPRAWGRGFAALTFLAASTYVVFVDASFWVVVATYFPSIVWLAAGYVVETRRRAARGRLLLGLVGLLLTLVAAGIQQAGVALHPRYFDHNALYHAVQALALLLVFVSTHALIASNEATTGEPCAG